MNTSDLDAQLAAGDITQAEYNAAVQAREEVDDDVKLGYYDSIIELFELDLRDLEAVDTASQERYYFTNQVLPNGKKIKWRRNDNASSTSTVTYEPLPIAATNFEKTTKGQLPTPELTVSNIFGTLSELIEDLDDLIGARIVRRRTLVKHLVGQSDENLNSYFPSDIFYIERKVREDSLSITFQLASPLDLEGLQLPKRVITQNYCVWEYRGDECGYNGDPVADAFNGDLTKTGQAAEDKYVDALRDFRIAKKAHKEATAVVSVARANKENKCENNVKKTEGGYSEDNANNMYFGLKDENDKETIMIIWRGNNRTDEDGTGYAIEDSGRISTPHDNYGTGPLYMVEKYSQNPATQTWSQPQAKINVSSKATATFAVNPNQNQSGKPAYYFAVYEGQEVTLTTDQEYRLGSVTSTELDRVYRVNKLDDTACDEAEQALQEARDKRDEKSDELATARQALQAAAAALPANSALLKQDICGKQLSSCRLRFEGGQLPFGGFPGANLSR